MIIHLGILLIIAITAYGGLQLYKHLLDRVILLEKEDAELKRKLGTPEYLQSLLHVAAIGDEDVKKFLLDSHKELIADINSATALVESEREAFMDAIHSLAKIKGDHTNTVIMERFRMINETEYDRWLEDKADGFIIPGSKITFTPQVRNGGGTFYIHKIDHEYLKADTVLNYYFKKTYGRYLAEGMAQEDFEYERELSKESVFYELLTNTKTKG